MQKNKTLSFQDFPPTIISDGVLPVLSSSDPLSALHSNQLEHQILRKGLERQIDDLGGIQITPDNPILASIQQATLLPKSNKDSLIRQLSPDTTRAPLLTRNLENANPAIKHLIPSSFEEEADKQIIRLQNGSTVMPFIGNLNVI